MTYAYTPCPWCDRLALAGSESCWWCHHRIDLPPERCTCSECTRQRLAAPPRSGHLARPAPWWLVDQQCAAPGPIPGCECAWCAAKVGEVIGATIGGIAT